MPKQNLPFFSYAQVPGLSKSLVAIVVSQGLSAELVVVGGEQTGLSLTVPDPKLCLSKMLLSYSLIGSQSLRQGLSLGSLWTALRNGPAEQAGGTTGLEGPPGKAWCLQSRLSV